MPALRNNALIKLSSDGGVLVHEDPSQSIQGGLPNEHYHLNEEQYNLINTNVHLKIYEPVSNDTAEILFNDDGDVLMEWGGDYAS